MLEEKLQSEPVKAEARGSGGDFSVIGVTYCKRGGSGSSDRFCPPIQGEGENRDGGNGPCDIRCRGEHVASTELGMGWLALNLPSARTVTT